jgi:hypothetical protein
MSKIPHVDVRRGQVDVVVTTPDEMRNRNKSKCVVWTDDNGHFREGYIKSIISDDVVEVWGGSHVMVYLLQAYYH